MLVYFLIFWFFKERGRNMPSLADFNRVTGMNWSQNGEIWVTEIALSGNVSANTMLGFAKTVFAAALQSKINIEYTPNRPEETQVLKISIKANDVTANDINLQNFTYMSLLNPLRVAEDKLNWPIIAKGFQYPQAMQKEFEPLMLQLKAATTEQHFKELQGKIDLCPLFLNMQDAANSSTLLISAVFLAMQNKDKKGHYLNFIKYNITKYASIIDFCAQDGKKGTLLHRSVWNGLIETSLLIIETAQKQGTYQAHQLLNIKNGNAATPRDDIGSVSPPPEAQTLYATLLNKVASYDDDLSTIQIPLLPSAFKTRLHQPATTSSLATSSTAPVSGNSADGSVVSSERIKAIQDKIKEAQEKIVTALATIEEEFLTDNVVTLEAFSHENDEKKPYVVESGHTYPLDALQGLQKVKNNDRLTCPLTKQEIYFSKKRLNNTLIKILEALANNKSTDDGGRNWIATIMPLLMQNGKLIEEPVISPEGDTCAVIQEANQYTLIDLQGNKHSLQKIESGKYFLTGKPNTYFYTNYFLKSLINELPKLITLHQEEEKLQADLKKEMSALEQQKALAAEKELESKKNKEKQEPIETYLDDGAPYIADDKLEEFCEIIANRRIPAGWYNININGRNLLGIIYDSYPVFDKQGKLDLYKELVEDVKLALKENIFSKLYNQKIIDKIPSVCGRLKILERVEDKARSAAQKKLSYLSSWWVTEEYTPAHKVFSELSCFLTRDIFSSQVKALHAAIQKGDSKEKIKSQIAEIKKIDPELPRIYCEFVHMSNQLGDEIDMNTFSSKFLAFYASKKIMAKFDEKVLEDVIQSSSFKYGGFLAYCLRDNNGMQEGTNSSDALLPCIDYLLTQLQIKISPDLLKINDILVYSPKDTSQPVNFSQTSWIPYRGLSTAQHHLDWFLKILARHGNFTNDRKNERPLVTELRKMQIDYQKKEKMKSPITSKLFTPEFSSLFESTTVQEGDSSSEKFLRLIARIEMVYQLVKNENPSIPELSNLQEAFNQVYKHSTESSVRDLADLLKKLDSGSNSESSSAKLIVKLSKSMVEAIKDIHPAVVTATQLGEKVVELFEKMPPPTLRLGSFALKN
jgi:hypothetical protein